MRRCAPLVEHEYVAQCLREERKLELVLEHLAQPSCKAVIAPVRIAHSMLSTVCLFVYLMS